MTGVSLPVVWAIILTLAGAWLWHVIVDHHGHLVLLRIVRPSTVVPETRHSSKWHRAGHLRRLVVNAILVGAAILVGLAYELSPYAALALVAGSAVTFAIFAWMRRPDRIPEETGTRVAEGSKS